MQMKKIAIIGSLLVFVILVYGITNRHIFKHINHESNSDANKMERFLTYAEIERYRQSWEEKQDEIIFSYSTSLGAEIAERGNVHQLDYNFQMQIKNKNRHSNRWVNSDNLIKQYINNDWNLSALSDSIDTESLFRSYAINRDAHYRVKIIDEKISHIVFQEGYTKEVIRDIYVDMEQKEAIALLGIPDFQMNEYELIGYMFDEFYVFLIGEEKIKEITVYRREEIKETDLEELIQLWEKEGLEAIEALERVLPQYEYAFALSSAEVYGYETAGVIVRQDVDALRFELDLFEQYEDEEIIEIKNVDVVTINDYTHRDAVLDIEVYRIAIEKMLMDEQIGENINLGMSFQNVEHMIYSPDKKKACYYKGDTIDDNYPCLYLMDLSDKEFIVELLVDPFYKNIYWYDERFLVYIGRTCSFIYDLKDSKMIPLPEEMLNGYNEIKTINDEGVLLSIYEEI